MYMDLTDMISGGTEEQQVPEQKLTKEEYAAKKQQEREEVWAEVDSQAQGVFQEDRKSTRLNSSHPSSSRMPSSA